MSSPASLVRVSVAMATYNGERYIREQLESIAHQDVQPLELVVTDDGSTDATLQIVAEFARYAPFPVRAFRNETRLGYADNFMKAASLCRGDLIAFCDQDDIWAEQKLKVCTKFFADPEVLLAVHSAQLIGGSNKYPLRYPHFRVTKILDHCDPFANGPGFAMVIRKSLLDLAQKLERPARLSSHDHWLWFLAASGGKVMKIADVLTLYRQHGQNIFGAPQPNSIARHAKNIACTVGYEEHAAFESHCSCILLTAAEQSTNLADRLRKSSAKLEFRARLHRIRNQIYSKDSNLPRRVAAFLQIFCLVGYLPDQSGSRLGPRAALKDMLFGVPGVHQLLMPSTPPSKEA